MSETGMDAYLPDGEDYPDKAKLMLRGHTLGVRYTYVGTPWLDGLVNSCKPFLAAFVVERYRVLDAGRLAQVAEQQGFHSKLDAFGDDVLLLGQCVDEETGEPVYVVLWFDCDVSDSCIGFFKTDDPEEKVVAAFEAWVRERSAGWKGDTVDSADGTGTGKGVASGQTWSIPLKSLKGWLSW